MNNLRKIEIKNYKCFKHVSFNFRKNNILIGENNAGKSTAIEAIKLLAFGIDKLKNGNFIQCPTEISQVSTDRCVKLNIADLLIDLNYASYKYEGGTTVITGYFNNSCNIKIYVIEKNVYAMAFDSNNKCLSSKIKIKNINLPSIFVMPRFTLLRDTEKYINEDRTKKDRFNYRSSLHFRNELYNNKQEIEKLNDYLKKTWNGVHVSLEFKLGIDEIIKVTVRDFDFPIEIQYCGSGLQMWVQILWFLCKINLTDCIVVLDEPDVYIHADLQRKLYHLVSDKYTQTIIATHSIEIINEANLHDIMVIDKKKKYFSFCMEKKKLDLALKSIGTSQNIMLTKLDKYNKCLFVEGDDIDILDDLYKIVLNDPYKSLNDFANTKINGKNNYKEIFGAAKLFHQETGGTFRTFCLLDKDYDERYNNEIKKDAKENNVNLYILNRVEIENYLIVPRIIAKLLKLEEEEVERNIVRLAETLKGETFDRILQEKFKEVRDVKSGEDLSTISKDTRNYIDEKYNSLDNIMLVVSGKELKAKIFDWAKKEYNISLTNKKIIAEMTREDLPKELAEFLIELSK